MIKVAFDIRPLNNPQKYRGVGVYTQNLYSQLRQKTKKVAVYGFKHPQEITENTDLVHYPYFDPFSLTLPLFKKFPTVVTVHDLIPIIFPEHFPKGLKGWLKWQIQKLSLKRTIHIITDSDSSQKDIVKILKVKKDSVSSIHLAPASVFQPASLAEQRRIRKKLGLPEKFLLYVGDFNWNKNVPSLVKACIGLEIPLVVAGGKAVSFDYDPRHPENQPLAEFQRLVQRHAELTTTPGFLSQKDLIALYSTATFYCQPSFYEGFGLPVLEAMACGCPVICSSFSSLPEVAGEAAIYIKDPYSVQSIKATIKKAFNFSEKSREKIINNAFKQVKKFSWQKTAQETRGVYEKALKG